MKISWEIIDQPIPIQKKVDCNDKDSQITPLQITFDEVFNQSPKTSTKTISNRVRTVSISDSHISTSNRYPGRITDCLECRMGKHCRDNTNPFCSCSHEGHLLYV